MRSNSSFVVKLYSRPFSSDPRGGRVVHEIEKSTPITCLRSSLTSVLLPEPDGAEIIKRIPATCDCPFRPLSTHSYETAIPRSEPAHAPSRYQLSWPGQV